MTATCQAIVRKRSQVTIPSSVVASFGLHEGTAVDFVERDGELVLKPKLTIDADQAWFWTEKWQKKEREADEDIKAGRLSGPFNTTKALSKHLRELAK